MIRLATPKDADFVVPLMFQAMEEIVFKLIGKEDKNEAFSFLKTLFLKEKNQYSYQNTLVFEQNSEVIASLVFYQGADLQILREPVLRLSRELYSLEISLEDETGVGEVYIDTLSVSPSFQGKGIGSLLISYLKAYLAENQIDRIGLLVDEKNPKAERLYKRLGFYHIDNQPLAGGIYKHLVCDL